MSVMDGIVRPVTTTELRAALRSVGILTRAEALAAGASPARIDSALRNGTLIPVTRGVYLRSAVAAKVRGWAGGEHLLRVGTALATGGSELAVSHQSAARFLGITLLGTPIAEVTLTGPPGSERHRRDGIRVHAIKLPAGHVTVSHGLPVTTAARTVIDLARAQEFRAGLVAADSALHQRLTSKAELLSVIAQLPRRPGIARAAEVVRFADGRAESPLESIARVVIRDCGLPPPELQRWLGGIDEPLARVDFYWKRYRTAAEVDGAMKYNEDPGRARQQLRRDALLRAEGFELVHFTWEDVNSAPGEVGSLIRQAFRRQVRAGNAAARRQAS
jgi:hypothetical protein